MTAKVHDYGVIVRILAHPDGDPESETCAHEDSWQVSAIDPGGAAQTAWTTTRAEIKGRKKRLPPISRVLFSVTRNNPPEQEGAHRA